MLKKSSFLFILLSSFLLFNFSFTLAYDLSGSNIVDIIKNIVPSIKLSKNNNKVKLTMELFIPEAIKKSTRINRFEIYRNDILIATTTRDQFTDENLGPDTYSYKYAAYLTIETKNFTTSTTVYSSVISTVVSPTITPPTTTLSITTHSTTTSSTTTPSTTTLSTTTPLNMTPLIMDTSTITPRTTAPPTTTSSTTTPPSMDTPTIDTPTIAPSTTTPSTTTPPTMDTSTTTPPITPTSTISTPTTKSLKIYGKTLTPDGNILAESKIFIKTEKNELLEIESGDNAEFYFEVSGFQNISIISLKEKDSMIYRSKIINIALENNDQNINIYLEKEEKELPSQIEKKIETIKEEKIVLEDKAEITIPASLVTTTNVINVSIKPTIEIPLLTNFSPVSPVYEIKITNDQNREIKSFEKEIEIKIPYNPDELKAKGLTEDQIRLGYFDENKKNWSVVEKFSVDKINKVVIGYVKHLTKFAIISFADTSPPSPPLKIKFALIGTKKVKISWANPEQDFKYVRIYRSLDKNKWGSLLYDKVTSTEVIDENVKLGKTYYYLIKSVDYAGNESLNTQPITISIFKFTKYLKLGSRGADVKKLQEILIKENVFPEKILSGYFGPATKRAVIRLQEKYSKEILKPIKLKKGTGFVGPSTIKKLNQLLNEI